MEPRHRQHRSLDAMAARVPRVTDPYGAGARRAHAGTVWALGGVVCVLAFTGTARAQDLEPKAYSASPVGAAFLVVGLARSTGSILTDPTVPVKDVEATINAAPLAAGYTFGL